MHHPYTGGFRYDIVRIVKFSFEGYKKCTKENTFLMCELIETVFSSGRCLCKFRQ